MCVWGGAGRERERTRERDRENERENERENFPTKTSNLRHCRPLTEQRTEQIPEES